MCVSFHCCLSFSPLCASESESWWDFGKYMCGREVFSVKAAAEAHHIIQTWRMNIFYRWRKWVGRARMDSESFQLVVNASERVQSVWACIMMTFSWMQSLFIFCEKKVEVNWTCPWRKYVLKDFHFFGKCILTSWVQLKVQIIDLNNFTVNENVSIIIKEKVLRCTVLNYVFYEHWLLPSSFYSLWKISQ